MKNTTYKFSLPDILFNKRKRIRIFLELDKSDRVKALTSSTRSVRKDILTHIHDQEIVEIINMVDPDEATDLLQLLTRKKRKRILENLSDETRESLSTLLEFDPETAAGLMTLDYIQVDSSDTAPIIAQKFKRHEKKTGRPPVILVVDKANNGKLLGFIPGYELGFISENNPISGSIKKIPTISYAANHGKVVATFKSNPHNKVVVLNDAGCVIGIIYSDDVLRLIDRNTSSSLYDFAGVRSDESVTDNARNKFKFRYKWLLINLATAFLAAFTVGQFQGIISEYVLLAVYMPIVAGMGGNAATQTLAVLVRGIALKQIRLRKAMQTLKSEVGASILNGLLNGVAVAAVVIVLNGDYRIAAILALAMLFNLIFAAIFGTIIPLIMSALKKDPAASATIFITTATDVLGFLVFLGLATLVLPN